MSLLIDGYNLLWGASVTGTGSRGTSLERSRKGLLRLVSTLVPDEQRWRTTIVFDAREAPPGAPSRARYSGMTILFAAEYDEADTLIEELIRLESAPRRLTVVSSDHRIQRAARRRKAKAIDSDVWFEERLTLRPRSFAEIPSAEKPPTPLTAESLAFWLAELAWDTAEDFEPLVEESSLKEKTIPAKNQKPGSRRPNTRRTPRRLEDENSTFNPFPPGYGEDLLNDT
jgi:predicted RNA-binding protein with PIN domain